LRHLDCKIALCVLSCIVFCTKSPILPTGNQNAGPRLLKEITTGSGIYNFNYDNGEFKSMSVTHDGNTTTIFWVRRGDTMDFGEWRFTKRTDGILLFRKTDTVSGTGPTSFFSMDSINRVNSITNIFPNTDTIKILNDSFGNMVSIFPCDSFSAISGTWDYDTLRNPFMSLPIEMRLLSFIPFFGFNLGSNNPIRREVCQKAAQYADSLEEINFSYKYDLLGYPTICTLSVARCGLTDSSLQSRPHTIFNGYLFSYY
jgi:hypothetical protein